MPTTSTTLNSYNKFAKEYDEYLDASENFWNNYLEAPALLKLVGHDLTGKKILDLGCGSGASTARLAKLGGDVTGIDISEELLKLAREKYPKIEFVSGDIENLQFNQNSFDIVTASLVVHYLQDLSKLFKSVRKVLRNNGSFIFSMNHPMLSSHEKKYINEEKVYVLKPYFNKNKFSWTMVNKEMVMECFHHTFADVTNNLIDAGFQIARVVETQPIPEGEKISKADYDRTMLYPSFIIYRCTKYS